MVETIKTIIATTIDCSGSSILKPIKSLICVLFAVIGSLMDVIPRTQIGDQQILVLLE